MASKSTPPRPAPRLYLATPAVDDPTQVADDAVTIAEDGVATGNVLANDSDLDGPLQVASFQVGAQVITAGQAATMTGIGTVTIAADGSFILAALRLQEAPLPVRCQPPGVGKPELRSAQIDQHDHAAQAT